MHAALDKLLHDSLPELIDIEVGLRASLLLLYR